MQCCQFRQPTCEVGLFFVHTPFLASPLRWRTTAGVFRSPRGLLVSFVVITESKPPFEKREVVSNEREHDTNWNAQAGRTPVEL